LAKIHSLQSISLAFDYCGNIKKDGLGYLSEGLKGLASSLRSIDLNFYGRPKITNKNVKSLGECLESLIFLQTINLNLGFGFYITEEGLKSLWEGIKGLNFLKSVDLNLEGCREITTEALDRFIEDLKSMPKIEKIRIV